MAEQRTDRELLRDYTERGSESAFQLLVERHRDLVFATALRGLKDEGTAQEIGQNVFIALARKAAWLRGETSLASWLHHTTLLEIRRWWRGEMRRRRREQTAVELGTTMKDQELKALSSELDEGLLELRPSDRQALLLRYFEGRSHREIGVLLGAREDAVRMRIDKAVARLTQFFRRRGYAVPAVGSTVAVLEGVAKAAPPGFALSASRAAFSAGGGGATGLKLILGRFMGLPNTQTAVLCATLAVAPVALEWHLSRAAAQQAGIVHARLETIAGQQDELSPEVTRLRTESAQLDTALADAGKRRARFDEAALKLETLKTRLRGLLTDANYHWPDDLPYIRIRKETVKMLHQMGKFPIASVDEPALDLLAITADERASVGHALANYDRGIDDLMAAAAYETNSPPAQDGRLAKTVFVPPLGQPMRDLAADTAAQITGVLGAEREQFVFGDWEKGAIQRFWPGNQWNIADEEQTLTVWYKPGAVAGKELRYGSVWAGRQGSMGPGSITKPDGTVSEASLEGPEAIVQRFFVPWLEQFGITPPEAE